MKNLPEVTYTMADVKIIILSLVLALIATFFFKIILKFAGLFILSYRTISRFKRQLDGGEITIEDYNRKVRDFNEKLKNGEIGRK